MPNDNALDAKMLDVLAGRVVRKDLVHRIKSGVTIPVYVLEYLLAKYCSTDDPIALEAGLRVVNGVLADNYVRADEANKAQSRVRERGHHTVLDKVKVRYVSDEDKYWAELVHFGHKHVHVPEEYVRQYDRLLMGGVWAQVELRHDYDESAKGRRSPFWIDSIKPIQMASFDLGEYREARRQFDSESWTDVLLRSIGLEPSHFSRRLKLLLLARLIPLCESRFNLVELGPRGTGKSYAFQELSPYTILLTGPATVANLFYNMATQRVGLVGLWDAVAFDEVADLQKMPKEVVSTLKTYCESGTFARGKESLSGIASIALFGNTQQPVDVMVRASHLFAPLPEVIRDDMAFLDRLHFYLPGWEVPKMRNEFFTSGYGMVVDYLAEALKELRRDNCTEALDRHFALGSHLNARDAKAVRKTVSGYLKLLYPHGEYSRDELAEIVELALEGRRRVKEQLKKMGAFEYHQTSFSYLDHATQTEHYVGVPEEGGRTLIPSDPTAPGVVHVAGLDDDGRVGLHRVEVALSPGSGRVRVDGADARAKVALQRAFSWLQTQAALLGVADALSNHDVQVECVDLLGNRVAYEPAVGMLVALVSAFQRRAVLPALVVVGDMTVQGNLRAPRSLLECMETARSNGGRRMLVPSETRRMVADAPGELVDAIDAVFFGDLLTAVQKALGVK
jgi:ATP-dependent Lon protease